VGCIYGRHFLFLDLKEYNSKIERSLSRIKAKKHEFKTKIAEEQNPPPKELKDYFTLTTYDSPTTTYMPIVIGPFENKHSFV